MESYYNHRFDNGGDTHLPPGFRFHPTDEELITFYLLKKVLDSNFTARAIAEVDLNKCEPWELPGRAKMGEKEWYFFSLRDRKYPTGLRTNRATCAGYWKATGKDREIYSSKTCTLIGMKKTLVFYRGRAPRGEKSNWVMHEFRLEGKLANHFHSKPPKAEWVISRVFHKSCGGGAASTSGSAKPQKNRFNTSINLYPEASSPSSVSLPPLLDVTTTTTGASTTTDLDGCSYDSQTQPEHVSCFSTIIAAANHNYSNFNLATLPMAPSITDPFARFPRNNSTNAFPSLRPLHENLQLPFFSGSQASAVPQLPPFHGGGGGAAAAMNWMVSLEEGRVEGGGGGRLAMGPTELDCMWTY